MRNVSTIRCRQLPANSNDIFYDTKKAQRNVLLDRSSVTWCRKIFMVLAARRATSSKATLFHLVRKRHHFEHSPLFSPFVSFFEATDASTYIPALRSLQFQHATKAGGSQGTQKSARKHPLPEEKVRQLIKKEEKKGWVFKSFSFFCLRTEVKLLQQSTRRQLWRPNDILLCPRTICSHRLELHSTKDTRRRGAPSQWRRYFKMRLPTGRCRKSPDSI